MEKLPKLSVGDKLLLSLRIFRLNLVLEFGIYDLRAFNGFSSRGLNGSNISLIKAFSYNGKLARYRLKENRAILKQIANGWELVVNEFFPQFSRPGI